MKIPQLGMMMMMRVMIMMSMRMGKMIVLSFFAEMVFRI